MRALLEALEAVNVPVPSPTPSNVTRLPTARKTRGATDTVKINGVTVKKRWEWTKRYRRELGEMLANVEEPRGNDAGHLTSRATAYAVWMAGRDGLTVTADDFGWYDSAAGVVHFRRDDKDGGNFPVKIPNHDWKDPFAGTYEYQALRPCTDDESHLLAAE